MGFVIHRKIIGKILEKVVHGVKNIMMSYYGEGSPLFFFKNKQNKRCKQTKASAIVLWQKEATETMYIAEQVGAWIASHSQLIL